MKEGTTLLYTTETLGDRVSKYSESISVPVPQKLRDYHARIFKERDDSNYMISTFESQALIFLARMIGAKRVLEIGVYVGFSAMIWSHAVGPQGKVTGLEYDEEYSELARQAAKENGYDNIEIHTGDAAETLPKLAYPDEPYDIVFLDANKTAYPGYLAKILEMSQPGAKQRLVRPGGIIAADNALRRGLVADSSSDNPWLPADFDGVWEGSAVAAIRKYNKAAAENSRLETLMVPLWDGLNLARLVD
ncbi:S-adenosyl-L-methionine-dependent methyltransferase [Annulohypoxylon truncatum]|uniref:S-adenosyl-L-methionine-dependent methyltransferase n=1 Tax=Annulohypoxylon truncatum TaxID=327061 RepID=UPI002007295D|nr:S-adenosyl-L-methionine-dependent methyltransferase [Annulohypoxylon truncatum]KAI1207259.1 S-adenosyl-L-methionine-dependent methyltransferase [Annulohypoxylon truncatum]